MHARATPFSCSLRRVLVHTSCAPRLPRDGVEVSVCVPLRLAPLQDLTSVLASESDLAICLASPARLHYVTSALLAYAPSQPSLAEGDSATDAASLDVTTTSPSSSTPPLHRVELKMSDLPPALVHFLWCLIRRAHLVHILRRGAPLRMLLFAVYVLRPLVAERHWAGLLSMEVRRQALFHRAYAVCTTLGGAYATLRQRREARAYATLLRELARQVHDAALELRADIYRALAAPTRATRDPTLRVLWLRGIDTFRARAIALKRPELAGLCDYAISQRISSACDEASTTSFSSSASPRFPESTQLSS